jgi:2-desacetyl-2-hydroxyethyl bacteriochlorophyllide A dehydrogenase
MMRCGVVAEPGRFVLEERPLPEEAPEGWVLVDIAAVGICGTDYHIFGGRHPFLQYPRLIGHELSGHVTRDGHGWRAGQRVVINPYIACGTCAICLKDRQNCCETLGVLGVHRDGGMCARIAMPAGNLIDAGSLSAREAALVEFLAIGAHAVRRSRLERGARVLVTGAGPIGIGTALFARVAGAEVHLMDLSPARLAAAGALGFTELHWGPEVLPGGFEVVFDATGNPRAMEAGFAHVAQGGTYVLVSVVKGDIRFDDAEFHRRELTLMASRNATAVDFETVMGALASGLVPGKALITIEMTLDEVPAQLPDLAEDRAALVKALVVIDARD